VIAQCVVTRLNIHDNQFLDYSGIWRPVVCLAEFFPSNVMDAVLLLTHENRSDLASDWATCSSTINIHDNPYLEYSGLWRLVVYLAEFLLSTSTDAVLLSTYENRSDLTRDCATRSRMIKYLR
jgi:hypothetical protein